MFTVCGWCFHHRVLMVVTALFVCGQQCTKISHLAKKIKLSIVCWSYFENMAILYILSWLSTLFFSRFKCLFDVQINHCHCCLIYADALIIWMDFPKHDFRMIILPFYFSQRNLYFFCVLFSRMNEGWEEAAALSSQDPQHDMKVSHMIWQRNLC